MSSLRLLSCHYPCTSSPMACCRDCCTRPLTPLPPASSTLTADPVALITSSLGVFHTMQCKPLTWLPQSLTAWLQLAFPGLSSASHRGWGLAVPPKSPHPHVSVVVFPIWNTCPLIHPSRPRENAASLLRCPHLPPPSALTGSEGFFS